MIELANSVLTLALLSPEVIHQLDLSVDHFPLIWQQEVWAAIQYLHGTKSSVDIVLVSDRLIATKAEPPEDTKSTWFGFLAEIVKNNSASISNVKRYAEGLIEWRNRMRCVEIGNDLVERAMDGVDASDEAIRDLMALSVSTRFMDGPLADTIPEAIDALDLRHSANKVVHGIPFGITKLDEILSGMTNSHLYVLAARPAMGKTALALNISEINREIPTGYISTEQPRREMIDRLVSIHARVDGIDIRNGTVREEDWPRVMQAYQSISRWPMYMNDQAGPDITDVVRQARKWKHRYGIKLLIVDYIQRVKDRSANKRHEEVGGVIFALKNIARDLDIPVLALSQINRDVERRENKRPVLSDLRESGDIEQEADVIITAYRDEVYYDNAESKGKAELGIIKNRHGPLGLVHCHYSGRVFRFEDFGPEFAYAEPPPLPDAPPPGYRDNFTYHPE